MKKTSKKSSFPIRKVLLISLILLVAVVAVRIVELWPAAVSGNALSQGVQRHVENVQCSGACDNVLLVSSQEPGTRYFAGGDCPTCIEANIWAGKTREDQITINGYAFYDGVQVNLAPKTFGTEVLDGREISWVLPLVPPGATNPSLNGVVVADPTFIVHVKDTGDENLIDTVTYRDAANSMADNITIVTDHAAGRVTAFDTCTQTNTNTNIFALYQAADLHGPQHSDSYTVDIEHRDSLSTGTITGGEIVFQKEFIFDELTEQKLHVTADVGDATFDFDLVK